MFKSEQNLPLIGESTNWLTVFPTADEIEANFLEDFSKSLGTLPDTQIVVLSLRQALDTQSWQGQKLTGPQLELLQRVWQHIEKGVALGLDEAVNIRNREVSEIIKKLSSEEMMSGDPHSFDSGDYRGNLAVSEKKHFPARQVKSFFTPEYVPHLETGDTVNFIANRISQLLNLHLERPIVCVDIGAMKAATWLELAEIFSKEIKLGKLILIATNISQPIEDINPQANNDLVQFLVADVA